MSRMQVYAGGAGALMLALMASSGASALTLPGDLSGYTAFNFEGLAFNKSQQDHDVAPNSNDPASTVYTFTSQSGNTNISQAEQLLHDTSASDIGQFRYTLYVPNAQVSGSSWTSLTGSYIAFDPGDPMTLDAAHDGALSGTLSITGGVLLVSDVPNDSFYTNANLAQDLPFGFGQNITQTFYLLSGQLNYLLDLGDIEITGTFGLDHDKNTNGTFDRLLDPTNGNPANVIPGDLAFFFESISSDFTCAELQTEHSCSVWNYATQGGSGNQQHLLAVNLAGWGGQDVPEPTAIGLFGLGLLGLNAARRRRLI